MFSNYPGHATVAGGLYLVEEFHGLDNANCITCFHLVTLLDKRGLSRPESHIPRHPATIACRRTDRVHNPAQANALRVDGRGKPPMPQVTRKFV